MKPPIANTVSELRIFIPIANEMPDQANPKKALISNTTIYTWDSRDVGNTYEGQKRQSDNYDGLDRYTESVTK